MPLHAKGLPKFLRHSASTITKMPVCRFRARLLLSVPSAATLLLMACAGTQPEALSPTSEVNTALDPVETSKVPGETGSAEGENDTWVDDSPAIAPATEDLEASSNTDHQPREILYRVSQDGLRVQIEGSQFIPTVKAVKLAGRWGLKLSVTVTTEAERALLSPSGGPLAFGGQIKRSTVEKFGDRREGNDVVVLTADGPMTFSRAWPSDGQEGLLPGESLELQVGLWGLGPDAETLGPVRRFIVVKMSADANGARPVIEPPAN